MSLIEEALRKQAQEEGRRSQPSAPVAAAAPSLASGVPAPIVPPQLQVAPPQPVVAPPPAAAPRAVAASRPVAMRHASMPVGLPHPVISSDAKRQRKLTGLVLGGVGLLVALLALGAIFLLVSHGLRPATKGTLAPVGDSGNPHPRDNLATSRPAATVSAPELMAPVPVAPPVVAVAPEVPIAALAPAVALTASAPAVVVVTAAAVLPPEVPVVNWPAIKISGMFTSGGKTVVLFGDGTTLEAGATAPNGVQLRDVVSGAVRLSYKGQARTYRRNGGSFVPEKSE
ncbi:MAG: hypothetical protein ACOYOU_14065 [Kiritimatiellia bacterium]